MTLLQAAVEQPSTPVSRLPLLSRAQEDRCLAAYERVVFPASHAVPAEGNAYRLFEHQALATPLRTAVVCEQFSLTYAQLHAMAGRVAGRIARAGGRDVVGIYLGLSGWIPACLLGVLAAGAGYVPLDPSAFPAERLQLVVQDCGLRLILTEQRLLPALAALQQAGITVLCVDRDDDEQQPAGSVAAPAPNADPHALLYIVYTSGSTGTPTGVRVSHRNLVTLSAHFDDFAFDADSRVLQFHSFSFDLFAYEFFGALLRGGLLTIPAADTHRDPQLLHAYIAERGVTHLSMPPSAFYHFMAREVQSSQRSPLRCIMLCGEALDFGKLHAWFGKYREGGPAVVNSYGVSELCIINTWRPVLAADMAPGLRLGSMIGLALSNSVFTVMDEQLQLVPPGTPGELCVSGECVALGYVGRPELEAARFVHHPRLGRMYRTRDRALLHPARLDFEFLGRIDTQVKHLGYRVEPMEIERSLDAHPAVDRSAVVLQHNEAKTHTMLVAFVSFRSGASATGTQLRQFLETGRLPRFMIPNKFVPHEGPLPVNSNGKIDRKRLARGLQPADLERKSGADTGLGLAGGNVPAAAGAVPVSSAPGSSWTVDEERMRLLWSRFFQTPGLGATTHFFYDLGGHSLAAIRLVSMVQEEFGGGLELSPVALFAHPTPRRLAEFVAQQRAATATLPGICTPFHDVASVHGGSSNSNAPGKSNTLAPLVLVHPAGGGVLLYRQMVQRLLQQLQQQQGPAGRAVYAIDDGGAPAQTLDEVVRGYAEHVRRLGAPAVVLVGFSLGGVIAWEMARALPALGVAVEHVVLLDPLWQDLGEETDQRVVSALRLFVENVAGVPMPRQELAGSGQQLFAAAARLWETVLPDLNATTIAQFAELFKAHMRWGQDFGRHATDAGARPERVLLVQSLEGCSPEQWLAQTGVSVGRSERITCSHQQLLYGIQANTVADTIAAALASTS